MLQRAGATASPYHFTTKGFVRELLPKGDTGFPALQFPRWRPTTCCQPPCESVFHDDSATTEIDDALSVQGQALAHHAGHSHRTWPGPYNPKRSPD
jgi:exoribonuclease-2